MLSCTKQSIWMAHFGRHFCRNHEYDKIIKLWGFMLAIKQVLSKHMFDLALGIHENMKLLFDANLVPWVQTFDCE